MMAAVFEKTFIQNLQGRLIIRYCPEIVFSKDNLSNEITVKLYNGESEYSGGGTVSATVIRADGRTVPLTGTITGNVVSLALIESCMEVPGQIQIFIRLTSGNVKTTVFAGVFTAVRTETDSVIDPGTIIPSVTDLINQIDAAIDSIPADYSTLLGSVAGTYSASKTYAVGDYVWYDGALYRCTTAITTAESWTAAHWSRAVLGDDITSLKSAFNGNTEYENGVLEAINGKIGVRNIVVKKGSTKSEILRSGLRSGVRYTFTLTLASALGVSTFLYVEDNNGNNILSHASVGVTATETVKTFSFTPQQNYDIAIFKYTVSGSANSDASIISFEVTNESNLIKTYGDEINNLKAVDEKIADDLDYDIEKIKADQYDTTTNLLDFTYEQNLWKQGAPNTSQQYTIYFDKKYNVTTGQIIYGAVKLQSISGFRLVIFEYDSNDQFISRVQLAFNAQVGSYTVPSNVSYVYFGFTTNSASVPITPEQIVALGNTAYAGSESVTATDFPARYEPTVQNISKELAYYDLTGIHMVNGSIRGINADDVVNYYDSSVINYRVCTPDVHQYPFDVVFTPQSGYKVYFYVKESGSSDYTGSGWKTAAYTIPANAKWGVTIAKQTEDTSVPADLDTFCNAIITDAPLATLKEKIGKIEKEISSESDSTSYGVNIKYNDRTDALTQLTRLPMFLIFTDIHGFGQYLERIGDFYKENCMSYCKDVICLGDIIYNQFSDSFAFMEDSDFGKKVLLTIGNHDCYDGTTVGGVSATDLYNKFFSNVSLWNVVQPSGAAANGYCYYYKDYDNKIRIIVLNEYYWDEAQKTWFESVLASAKTAGLAVIVAQHQGNFTEVEYEPLTDYAFGTKGYSFIRYTNGYLERRNAVDSFISDGGQFVGWINGHSHAEQFGTFEINGRTQFNMTFSNAGQDSTSRMKIVNYSQDCFYYLAVDTTNKWVYVLTIGQAENKYFHRNLMLMYNYQTHEVVEYY